MAGHARAARGLRRDCDGLFCLTLGAREGIFRFVAVPLGVLMGVALTAPVQELLKSTAIPPSAIALGLPGALGLLSGFLPHTIAFVTLGGVGALAGAAVVGENEVVMGAVPGFFIAGVLGIVLSRVVDTIASAAFGALLVVGGLWAAFPKGGVAKLLESSPWTPAIVGVAAPGRRRRRCSWCCTRTPTIARRARRPARTRRTARRTTAPARRGSRSTARSSGRSGELQGRRWRASEASQLGDKP